MHNVRIPAARSHTRHHDRLLHADACQRPSTASPGSGSSRPPGEDSLGTDPRQRVCRVAPPNPSGRGPLFLEPGVDAYSFTFG